MKKIIAKNKCMKCSYQWEDFPGAFAQHQQCPMCGSLYWEWTNFNELKRK